MLNSSIEGEDSSIQQPSVEELWIINNFQNKKREANA